MSAPLACHAFAAALLTYSSAAVAFRGVPSGGETETDPLDAAIEAVTSTNTDFINASAIGVAPSLSFPVVGTNQFSSVSTSFNGTTFGTWLQGCLAKGLLSPFDAYTASSLLEGIANSYDY